MAFPRTILIFALSSAVAAGCGDGDVVTARTPVEAVTQHLKGSAGVRVDRIARLDFGGNAFAPLTDDEDDLMVPVNAVEYDEKRTTGVVGGDTSDLTTTYYLTNVPDELKGFVPTDLSSRTTRSIAIEGSGAYLHRADREGVPESKSWLHNVGCEQKWPDVDPFGTRELLSPEILGRLTASAPSPGDVIDGVTTVVHAGNGSPADFVSQAPGDDPVMFLQMREQVASNQVWWQVWVGPDQLPRRVRLTFTFPPGEESGAKSGVDQVDFTGWGDDVDVEPPPSDQVHETGTCIDPE